MADASQKEKQNARNLKNQKSTDQKKSTGESSKNKNSSQETQQIDALGYILFFFLLCFAIIIDVLPFVTSGTSTIVDWLLDIAFWMSVTFSLMLMTGDILGSLVGKRQAINATQTIIEFIPLIDVLPIHTIAIIIIFLDMQYGVIGKTLSKFK